MNIDAELEITKINQHTDDSLVAKPFQHKISMSDFKADDIKVTIDDHQMTLVGKHIIEDDNVLEMNTLKKSLTLPTTVDVNTLKCVLKDNGTVLVNSN